jgi:hypothetical protein
MLKKRCPWSLACLWPLPERADIGFFGLFHIQRTLETGFYRKSAAKIRMELA